MALLVEVNSGPNHWAGAYGPLLVLFWIKSVDPAVCKQLLAAVPRLAARQRDHRLSVLSVAMPGAENPSAEGRLAIAALLRDTAETVSRVAVVRDGHGFVASVVASVIIGIQMMARPSGGHRPFSSLEDAVPWVTADLADFASGEIAASDALMAITQQRRALLARKSAEDRRSLRAGFGG